MAEHIEIKHISANEIFIGINRMIILEGNIIQVFPTGEQTDEVAQAHLAVIGELLNFYPVKYGKNLLKWDEPQKLLFMDCIQ